MMGFSAAEIARPPGRRPQEAPLARLGPLVREAEAKDARRFLAAAPERVEVELRAPLKALCLEAGALFRELAPEDDDSELAGIAFAARLELSHVFRLLDREQDRASTLVACDITRESLLRSARAVLAGASVIVAESSAPGRAAALVRALYMRLKQVVDAVEAKSGRRALAVVEEALREGESRPEFACVRLSDRFVLENVHRRFLELASRGGTNEEIAELVADARAAIELLGGINRRPELALYDRHVIATGRDHLARRTASRALFVQMRELLRGRDPALDGALAATTRDREPQPALLARLDAELARVARELA